MISPADLTHLRFTDPEAVARALAERSPGQLPNDGGKLLVIAADHTGRGVLRAGSDPLAMASREVLLERCMTALSRPGVGGFLGTPDVVEDLAALGALEGKLVFGSMNRSGLPGSVSEVDDRITAWTAGAIVQAGLDGGKLLLRMDLADPHTPAMLEQAARAVDELASAGKTVILEPFISYREDGNLVNDLSPESVMRSITVASALGHTSARTWLKLPCVPQMEQVLKATTLPVMLLGGPVLPDMSQKMECWTHSLRLPQVKGLAIGRALLFPPDGDVAGAVDRIVEVM
ncbi:MAG: deoxyribose-phosphate aldolase [Propionibacteriaceae bacterium]|nr:deoxyribose-phosphate aldolase [Propionibacteriaceae bacterium]